MLDTQPLVTAERTELQCDVVWATSGGPSQLISEYQPVIATEGRARGGNGQMGDIRARMTLLLPCAVIVAVLLDHGRLGMAVAGRCGVRIDMAHASRGVCCAKQEDYGADAYKGAQGASAILELRRHQGQDVQGVWGDVQGGIREVRRSGALRRMMAEDRERGQLGKPSCPIQVIHQLREEVKVATENNMVTPTVEAFNRHRNCHF